VSSNTNIAIVIAMAIVLFRLVVGLICMVPLYFEYLQALQGHYGSYIKCAGLRPRAFSSIGDLEQFQANPLPRARASLEQTLHIFQREPHNQDDFGLVSAQLSMAYLCLEDKDYPKALEYAELVLGKNNNQLPPEGLDSIYRTVFQRQQATTRMYASEASCALGDPMTTMKYLVGDGKDDAFDRL
jgi:hypothetical protein